ncbi:thermostable hemolysin [uncultured Methylophaga sp.]|uniref:thermostable hemolysin n=1 Tax=uncultured Methylophaga sp. TaxID=285271 RepID=UPI0026215292|nr:thermostable hemolysin [uncultured Methylophaga sp.]
MEALFVDNVSGHEAVQPQSRDVPVLPVFSLTLHTPGSDNRRETEQFIHQRFAHHYGANLAFFLPLLLSASSENGIKAALGFQTGKQSQLFLEQYLDCDIATTLSLLTQSQIDRDNVVEIGNLASGRQRATQTLFLLLAQILHGAGYEWVVFTANRGVRTWLATLQLPTLLIREADPSRLNDEGRSWGRYYDDRPVVLAANIEQSFCQINTHPLMAQLRDSYATQIAAFQAQLAP